MKTSLSVLIISLMTLAATAAQWTIHCAKDNTAYVSISSNQVCIGYGGLAQTCGLEWNAAANWDYWLDQQFPEYADSGCGSAVLGIGGPQDVNRVIGWQEIYILIIGDQLPEAPIVSISELFLSTSAGVGGPNWENWQEATLPGVPGEYWIDFAPDATCRISTTQPADFGKWAWDGSINPSWVVAKKGFGKGHIKQPLPSPK